MANWYLETTNEDTVISTRIRLARNISGIPFINKITKDNAKNVIRIVKEALENTNYGLKVMLLKDMDDITKLSLVEKHIISPEFALNKSEIGAIAINNEEDICIMINEEDHLRIQVMKPGFNLEDALEDALELDDKISEKIEYSFDEKYGFLTACPTNTGTGLRASVMLHLPALRITGKIDRVLDVVNKVNLNVRGVYGEGSEAVGDLYQVSNKTSLGLTEEEIVNNVEGIVKKLVEQERKAREYLKKQGLDFEDKVYRAYGSLVYAKKLSYLECAKLISIVRLGINMGIIKEIDSKKLNKISVFTKPATLQKCLKKEMTPEERDVERGNLIKQIIEK